MRASDLYPTDGNTIDFAYGELGLAAFTFELGTFFFEECSQFENSILPTNLEALRYAFKASRQPYLLPAGPEVYSIEINPSHSLPGTIVSLTAVADDTRFNTSNGAEAVQTIQAAEVYVDTPYWITPPAPTAYPMSPTDGTFDEPIEAITLSIDTTTWHPGRHTLFIRAQDAAGNWGTPTAIFLYLGWDFFIPLVAR